MTSKLILIIDDDSDDRSFFVDALKELNNTYIAMEAEHGQDAIIKLQNLSKLPDYIFLDLNMPIMNGSEFLSYLNADVLLNTIPVIIHTTSVSPEDMKITSELGAKYYLPKTSDLSKLPSKIQFAINMTDAMTVK